MAGTTRSWQQLMALRTAEYRFYENSLRNYATIHQYEEAIPATEDLGAVVTGNIIPGILDNYPTLGTPRQSHMLGLPCSMLDAQDQHFDLPPPLLVADEAAFAIEYLGVPRRAMNQYDDEAAANRITLISDETGANPCYITLLSDNIGAATSNLVEVDMGGGVANLSSDGTWWRPDHPLHLVFTREAGVASESSMWLNGVAVFFGVDGLTPAAGDLGFSDAGILFNRIPGEDGNEPFCGGHFLVRKYDAQLNGNEVHRLWQRARKLMPNLMFPIPVLASPPA